MVSTKETVQLSLVVTVLLLVNFVDTSQLSVLREARNGDIFFGIRPCGPKAKALNGSGCQCEYPFNTFYEGISGTYCSQLWSHNDEDVTIISNEGELIMFTIYKINKRIILAYLISTL